MLFLSGEAARFSINPQKHSALNKEKIPTFAADNLITSYYFILCAFYAYFLERRDGYFLG